jgi:ElaB/YqjD/DUF883 family membrane-anchored ribosome-binding protein
VIGSIFGISPSGSLVNTLLKKFASTLETKNSKKYQEYIKMRNQVKELVRKAKANMEKEIAKNAKKIIVDLCFFGHVVIVTLKVVPSL